MQRSRTTQRIVMGVAAVVSLIIAASVGLRQPKSAQAAAPTTYAHSWYITSNTNAFMDSLASADAAWLNQRCTTRFTYYLTVLNFGRPGINPNSGNYGVLDHASGGQWLDDSTVTSLAEEYAKTWYNDSTSCPYLYLVIGNANDYECFAGMYESNCSVYTAGVQWDQVVWNVQDWINGAGYASQETIWGGDDMEGEWDPWQGSTPQTVDFVNGFTYQIQQNLEHYGGSAPFLVDYGDADAYSPTDTGGPKWTWQNVYDAAWGIGWDVPLPETYYAALVSNWQCVQGSGCGVNHDAGTMMYYGDMTECSAADPLPAYPPTEQCWVQKVPGCYYDPSYGFNQIAGQTDPNYQYETNIQWPGGQQGGSCSK